MLLDINVFDEVSHNWRIKWPQKKKNKNGQTGCTGTRVSNVLQWWTKNTKYAFVSDHMIHAGNNACISSFWEKQNLFSAFLGLFDITLLGITVMYCR